MKRAAIVVITLLMAGCAFFQRNEAKNGYAQVGTLGEGTNVLVTTADVRIVTERKRGNSTNPVVCTEPSPDVSKALSIASNINVSGGTPQANGQVGFAGSSAEAIAELAGRSTALLALRDGLFHTCEAYANGALGADAYALVLARYGQLMTTLFLGQDITSAITTGNNSGPTSVTSPTVNVVLPSGSSAPPKQGQAAQATPASSNGTGTQQGALWTVALTGGAVSPTGANGTPPTVPATPPAAAPGTTPQGGNSTGSQSSTPPAAAIGAISLARMNEDYFDLDRDPVPLLLVACINEADPTREDRQKNMWLSTACNNLNSATSIAQIISSAATSPGGRPGAALDPVSAFTAGKSAGTTQTPAGGTVTPVGKTVVKPAPAASTKDGVVLGAQAKLHTLGFNVGPLDGVLGPQTRDAIRLYQIIKKLPITGDLDAATLSSLGVAGASAGAAAHATVSS